MPPIHPSMSESSVLQSVLASFRQNDYVTVTILTTVGYDYVLTFSNEVEYIWSKPWTWVSALFVCVCIKCWMYCHDLQRANHCYRFDILVSAISC
ncbi:hypothetical protein L210DRAFT_3536182, partial [Boletus edulis BED1]